MMNCNAPIFIVLSSEIECSLVATATISVHSLCYSKLEHPFIQSHTFV